MQKRFYGPDREALSVIGFAGIIVMNETPADASRFVGEAIDLGVNYFDVAPSYGDAQDRLGPALAGRRNGIFLACKTGMRTRQEALDELHHSLEVLQTDHFDLYQLHGVTTVEEVETVFGPNGAMETFVQAKKDGKIRHIGFSAHSDEAAVALLDHFPFESVLFPLNWATYLKKGFGQPTVAKAEEKGASILALKALARSMWPASMPPSERPYPKCWYQPLDDPERAAMALRFTLSLPAVSAITPGDIRLFRMAAGLTSSLKPISDAEISQMMHWDPDLQTIFK
jgi:aryl-alcohol dehydrogenase-like predicted oxidoreductase